MFFCVIFVEYLGNGVVYPVYLAVSVFYISIFGRGLKLLDRGSPETKRRTSIVARVMHRPPFTPD